jgi:hypothetical protein
MLTSYFERSEETGLGEIKVLFNIRPNFSPSNDRRWLPRLNDLTSFSRGIVGALD